jgi:hypothetical protein
MDACPYGPASPCLPSCLLTRPPAHVACYSVPFCLSLEKRVYEEKHGFLEINIQGRRVYLAVCSIRTLAPASILCHPAC